MDLPNHFIKCASNRRDPSNGFVNEVSSRATVEEQKLREARELKAKLAAEEVAKAAAKAAADNAQEFKRLRDLTVTYEIQIEDLGKQLKQTKSDFTDVQGKKTSLESSNSDLAKKLDSERVESARARQEASNHNNTIATLNSQLDARRDLDSNNNLDPGCHGRQAYLVHLGSRTAVDFGADGATRAHGHGFDVTNSWQNLTFEKVDPGNRFSNWTIRVNQSYLEFRSGGDGPKAYCSRRSGQQQEWKIGRVGGRGYVLQNAYWKSALDIERASDWGDSYAIPPKQLFYAF